MPEQDPTVSDLPKICPKNVAFYAQTARIDIPEICWICRNLENCPFKKIQEVDFKFNPKMVDPNTSVTEICPDFRPVNQ